MKPGQRKALNAKIAKMKKPKDDDFLDMLLPKHLKAAKSPKGPRLTAKEKAERKAKGAELARTMNQISAQMVSALLASPSPFAPVGPLAGSFGVQMVEHPIDTAKLETLNSIAPRMIPAPEKPMPDYVQAITGWRAWGVKLMPEGLRLKSLGQDDLWEPRQPKHATCRARRFPIGSFSAFFDLESEMGSHAAPEFNCSCGVWAFKDKPTLVAALANYDNIAIIGQVALWGKVVETQNGWRAETAYPLELWLLTPQIHTLGQEGYDTMNLEDLSYIYNVPIRVISE